jgi:hypothetical protein
MKNLIKSILLLLTIFGFYGCKPTAQSIVNECIAAHGGEKYDNLWAEFDFRDMHYSLKTKKGEYTYIRVQLDSSGRKIEDILTNNSFQRRINDEKVDVPDSMFTKYSSSVNSIAYFFLLPKPLNDPAAIKELVGSATLKGKEYYKIKVSFNQEGGGQDHDDVFMYWIDKETKSMDYLAYTYNTNGGGIRFREAFNQKIQNGIKYCDYKNYGFEDLNYKLEELDLLFEQNKIPLKSEIINLNVIIK